jgi:hypothetical protein
MSSDPEPFPEMATESLRPRGEPADGPEQPITKAWPAPAPAPIAGAVLDPEDTWMTFGLGVEGEEDDRTVTVVFSRPTDDSTEFLGEPFSPVFPERR